MKEIGLSQKQLIEYVSGKRTIRNAKELSAVWILTDDLYYNFTSDEAMDVFERYDNDELTVSQITWHILLLYSLAVKVFEKGEEPLSPAKRRLMEMFLDENRDYYIDEPLPLEVIEEIRKLFKEEVAVC